PTVRCTSAAVTARALGLRITGSSETRTTPATTLATTQEGRSPLRQLPRAARCAARTCARQRPRHLRHRVATATAPRCWRQDRWATGGWVTPAVWRWTPGPTA